MPEETTTPATDTSTDSNITETTALIAGKFKDDDAFNQAFASLATHEKVGLPELASAEFESQDAKVARYKRMESMLGKPPVEKPTTLELGGDIKPAAPTPIDMNQLIEKLGVDQNAMAEQFTQSGKLSDEVAQQFGQAKIVMPDGSEHTMSAGLVETYMNAQVQGNQYKQVMLDKAVAHVGGQENFAAIQAFGNTLDPVTQQSINLELNNPSTMTQGLDRLNQLYAKQVGSDLSNGIFSDAKGASMPAAKTPFKTRAEEREFRTKHGEDDPTYQSRLIATPDEVLNRLA